MIWRKFCRRFYIRAQSLIVPGLVHSQFVYAQKLKGSLGCGSKWLELGCGHELLRSWSISSDEIEEIVGRQRLLVGIDLTYNNLRKHSRIHNKVCGTATCLPFTSGTFDIVSTNMVVEHLDQVSTVLSEIHRILAPGGIFIFHTTNRSHYMFSLAEWIPQKVKNGIIWFLQRRHEEDVYPTLYKMNDETTIENLAASTGFTIRELNLLESESQTIVMGPFVVMELIMTRILLLKPFRRFRSNIIAVLQKPEKKSPGIPSSTTPVEHL